MQVAHDQPGQALVKHEQALADRVRVLAGDRDRPLQDLVRLDAAIDIGLDKPDPVLDDLRLLAQIILAARLAMPRHDRLDIERRDPVKGGKPFPGIAFLHPGPAFVEDVVAGKDDPFLGHIDRGLRRGVAGHVDDVEGVIADIERQRSVKVRLGPCDGG